VAAFSPVAREQRFLVTHGAMDPLIPIETMRPQVARLQAAGLRIQWQEFAKAHTLAGEAEFALIRQFIQARF
jgi:predicted esterase